MAFFHGRRSALVDISGQIDKMYAALCLLARLDPHDGQGNVAAERLAQQFSPQSNGQKSRGTLDPVAPRFGRCTAPSTKTGLVRNVSLDLT